MALGFYKPGQGYWVRVMTAAMIAVITFATAGWLMGQMAVLAEKLPVRAWTTELENPRGKVEPGQRVQLIRGATPIEVLGTAEVKSFDPSSQLVTIHDFTPAKEDNDPTAASAFAAAEGTGFAAGVKGGMRKIPAVQPVILQGVGAAVVLLLGAVLAFYFAGVKKNTVEFLISTDMEMKKVNWSTKRDIKNSTLVVVGAAVLLASALFGIDVIFQQFFKVIKVLQ
jgi:preprotein translocase SecE subunit